MVYTFNRMLTETGTVNTEVVDQIKGSDEVLAGTAESIEGVEAVDDYTLKVTLKEPFAAFLACLSDRRRVHL